MFTRQVFDLDAAGKKRSRFGKAHSNIDAILNRVARFSEQATLNPNETFEFSAEMEHVGGKCLILDGYACHSDDKVERFGLLALIEVFRSEMEFAREKGGAKLIKRLKKAGHYPYSDLDRKPVA